MAVITTMAMLKPRCMSLNSPNKASGQLYCQTYISTLLPTGSIARAIFSAISQADAAFAAQQIADIAQGDSRGTALLLPIIPAIAWVLYNIFQPALNRGARGISSWDSAWAAGLTAAGFVSAPSASAGEMAAVAEAAASDDEGAPVAWWLRPSHGFYSTFCNLHRSLVASSIGCCANASKRFLLTILLLDLGESLKELGCISFLSQPPTFISKNLSIACHCSLLLSLH